MNLFVTQLKLAWKLPTCIVFPAFVRQADKRTAHLSLFLRVKLFILWDLIQFAHKIESSLFEQGSY
jgi:hypothetical protein